MQHRAALKEWGLYGVFACPGEDNSTQGGGAVPMALVD